MEMEVVETEVELEVEVELMKTQSSPSSQLNFLCLVHARIHVGGRSHLETNRCGIDEHH